MFGKNEYKIGQISTMAVINQYTSLSITVINKPAVKGPTVVAKWPIVEFNAIAFGRIVGDTKLARNAA